MKHWTIIVMLLAGLLVAGNALAADTVDVTVDCPSSGTATRGSTITVVAHVHNHSVTDTFFITKYALMLNLGGLNITGPQTHALSFSVIPNSTANENISVPIPSRAAVGTVAQIGIGFLGTTSADSSVKPRGGSGCVVEIN